MRHALSRGAVLLALLAGCPGEQKQKLDHGLDQYVPLPPDSKPSNSDQTTKPKDGPQTVVDKSTPSDGPPPAHCQPYCGTWSGQPAWFDGCTKQVLKLPGTNDPYYDNCTKCTAVCKSAGTPAEGWYNCYDQLIISMKCS
jgi:hypothetical protein